MNEAQFHNLTPINRHSGWSQVLVTEITPQGISLWTCPLSPARVSEGAAQWRYWWRTHLPNAGNRRNAGSIPGSGRFPREGNGNLLQHSCLENSTDIGARRATVHRVTESWTTLKWLSTRTHTEYPRINSLEHPAESKCTLIYNLEKCWQIAEHHFF